MPERASPRPSWYAFLTVRDCAGSIADAMGSMLEQTWPPARINVVDDGSVDGTGRILDNCAAKHDRISVIHKHSPARDYSRIPGLWNEILLKGYDYSMVTAGDIILERDYAEKIVGRMEQDPELAVASGVYDDRPRRTPTGAGRLIRASFFDKHYARIPERAGYESEILLRAAMNGYKTAVFPDCRYIHTDKLGHGHNFAGFGEGMRALGYHPLYVIARCAVSVLDRTIPPLGTLNMLRTYLMFRQASGYHSLFDGELRNYVRAEQKNGMRAKLKEIIWPAGR